MSPLATFVWGFAGSVAVEVVSLLGHYYSEPVRLPQRYRKVGFWLTRALLALLGGALAVGYEIEGRILAFNIGAATPLIITSLARGIRPAVAPPELQTLQRQNSRANTTFANERDGASSSR